MKILFYVEPHPIRESHSGHYWIVSELLEMLHDEFANKRHAQSTVPMRLLVSEPMKKTIKARREQAGDERFLIGLNAEENARIEERYTLPWDRDGIELWRQLMTGEGEIAAFYETILRRIYYEVYDFDVVVYWGTNGAVRRFADTYGIPAVAMELGCTRKPFFDSLYFDFMGVNGAAYTDRIAIERVEAEYDPAALERIVPFSLQHAQGKDGLYNPVVSENAGRIYAGNGKNVLIPLQLADDANILLYSEYDSMFAFLQEVIPVLENAGFTCFVKPHPGNVLREFNRKDHERCEAFCTDRPCAVWLDDIENNRDYPSLLKKMDAVVTINSSVGFEAMLLGRTVVALGESPYRLSSALPTLQQLITGTIDRGLYAETVRKIVNLLLFHYLYFKEDGFSYAGFVAAIRYNSRLAKLYEADTAAFESTVLCTRINTLETYRDFPVKQRPERTEIRTAPEKSVSLSLYDRYRRSRLFDAAQYIKKIPLVGGVLRGIKHKVLRWY